MRPNVTLPRALAWSILAACLMACNGQAGSDENLEGCTESEITAAGCSSEETCYKIFRVAHCFCGVNICDSNEVCSGGNCDSSCTSEEAAECGENEYCELISGSPTCFCFGQECGDNQYCSAHGHCENTDRLCTGYELLKVVRADPEMGKTPFILVTAESKQDNINAAKSAGVSGYIIKPFNEKVLKEKIDAALAAPVAA